MSAARDHDHAHITELFAGFGPVAVRRMFSGAGIFAGGVMIALVSKGVIYLKADAGTIPAFEAEGLGPFTYSTRTGQRSLASYWRMPDRLYDNPEELAYWARQAFAVALSTGAVPKKRRAKIRRAKTQRIETRRKPVPRKSASRKSARRKVKRKKGRARRR